MLRFAKYHGLGNDFVVIDRLQGGDAIPGAAAQHLCDRHRGVGADGVLVVWPDPSAEARMQVLNADGSESAMCGNGLRCVARYLYDAGVVTPECRDLSIRAGDEVYACTRVAEDLFRVVMGQATDRHPDLPPSDVEPAIEVEGQRHAATCLFIGNPHAIVFVGDAQPMELARAHGPALEHHEAFRKRTNVTFARRTDSGFEAVVHERGVGITQACGSGACALGAAAVRRGHWPTSTPMDVQLPGGSVTIVVSDSGIITMEGEAQRVFAGEVSLP